MKDGNLSVSSWRVDVAPNAPFEHRLLAYVRACVEADAAERLAMARDGSTRTFLAAGEHRCWQPHQRGQRPAHQLLGTAAAHGGWRGDVGYRMAGGHRPPAGQLDGLAARRRILRAAGRR